ncbi:phosphoenolpyruvate--protein phosphotransferase [Thaumasiovibrio sp. DFM-14]|uniref:phosphoenolpyruvate--protein phosphotransferase n=1 Tax=Thaumasiovibrio sp. DFM-14 TaxID=3384792 RepID=UPI0039A27495
MLQQLRDIVEQVAGTSSLPMALDTLVVSTCKAMKTEVCSVYIADERRQCYHLMATQGLNKRHRHVALKFGEGLVGYVGQRAEPINVADAKKHKHFKALPGIGEESFRSFLGTPIIHRRQVLGVLVVQQREQRQFDESEESFLVTLAAQLAVALAHAKAQGVWLEKNETLQISGVASSSGVAIATGYWDDDQPQLEQVLPTSSLDVEREMDRLFVAMEQASNEFRRLRKRFDHDLKKETLAIFDLFSHLLNDPMLRRDLEKKIAGRAQAEWAVRQVVEAYSLRFAQMSDSYLKERAQDVRELGQRLLYYLSNDQQPQFDWPEVRVLFTRELTAATLAAIPRDKLAGVVAMEGASNSHAAILLRALGIPAVMGTEFEPKAVHSKQIVVDGYQGQVLVAPTAAVVDEYRQLAQEDRELAAIAAEKLTEPCVTLDGRSIQINLNAGLSADSTISINQGVDGVGLYRTEVPFLLQRSFPSEDEQYQQYRDILKVYRGKRVVMRTLDVGGDKPLPYLAIDEDNPFLGWRGIRFTLDHPDIFLIQVRAMLRASIDYGNLDILLPMISGIAELDDALTLINQAFVEVAKQAVSESKVLLRPRIGVMIEVPSMLYQLDALKGRVAFLSVGSNDLTQYLLAVDRNNVRVAPLYDALHPAVIAALDVILQKSKALQLPVCVCGELAGDPLGALLLTGMGYEALSMNNNNVAIIKYILRQANYPELQALAHQCSQAVTAKQVHTLLKAYIEKQALAGFIRPGK